MNQKPPYLHTQRLLLGPIRASDESDMLRIFLNDDVRKTYMIPQFRAPEEAISLFRRFRDLSLSDTHVVYGIYLQDRLIGFLNDVHTDGHTIEVGYVIHPDYKNHGYATEALSAVIQALFSMGYATVKAGAFAGNRASIRVIEKCGLEQTALEEELNYCGILHRCTYYAISNSTAKK